jgi:thymidylate synthase
MKYILDQRMNKLDEQYQALLQDIIDNGVTKQDRTGTGTISVFGRQIRHKMSEGFPLITTKKMYFKGIVTELLWFLRGDTNIKFLVDNNCHIWDGDAYQSYLKRMEGGREDMIFDKETFVNEIKNNDREHFWVKQFGDLGPIYGKQWRNWGGWKDVKQRGFLHKTDNGWAVKWSDLHSFANGTEWLITPIQDSDQSLYSDEDEGKKVYYKNITLGYNEKSFCPIQVAKVIDDKFDKYVGGIDQIQNLINDLKTNPDSRRLMVNAWNIGELDSMVLPPCHYGFQVYTRELSPFEIVEQAKKDGVWRDEIPWGVTLSEIQQNFKTRAISLMWNQRSVDTFLGLPFNIASYGLLLEIIAKAVNMVPDELIGNLGDTHLYSNHIDQAREQIGDFYPHSERAAMLKDAMGETEFNNAVDELMPFGGGMGEFYESYNIPRMTRQPFPLPTLNINTEFWQYEGGECGIGPLDATGVIKAFSDDNFCRCLIEEDIQLINYQSHPSIKAPLSN